MSKYAATKELVVSPSTFTSAGGAHHQSGDEGSLIYEDTYVSGAVVPFSWEERPGVPLLLSSKFGLELRKEMEEGVFLVNSKASLKKGDSGGEEALTSKHILLFPLPPPPCSRQNSSKDLSTCTKNTMSKPSSTPPPVSLQKSRQDSSIGFSHHNTSRPRSLSLNASNGDIITSTHNTKAASTTTAWPTLNANMKKPHISNKAKSSSFPPFLSKSYVGTAISLKDDPFFRAMQACTQSGRYCNYNTKPSISTDCDSFVNRSFHHVAWAKDAGSKAASKRRAIKEVAEDMPKSSTDSNDSAKVSLRRLIMEKEETNSSSSYNKARSYEGNPAFMVASFQQSSTPKKQQSAIAKAANSGWFSCRSADVNYNSIVRLYHH